MEKQQVLMSKFSEYIGSQFGNPRGIVGRICCIIMNVINRAMYVKTVSLINVENDQKVLDIGYGNGFLLKCLDRKLKPELYGIDISADMLSTAEKRSDMLPPLNLRLKWGLLSQGVYRPQYL